MRRKLIVAGSLVAAIGTTLGAVLVLRSQPMVSDEEVASAREDFERRERESVPRCERPPLRGEEKAGSGTEALARLLAPEGAFGRCMAIDPDAMDVAFTGASEGVEGWRWNLPDPENWIARLASSSEEGPLAMAAPPYPSDRLPAVFREALDACEGLPRAIADVVAHERLCSPWRDGTYRGEPHHFIGLIRLVKGLRVIARDRARSGDGAAAIGMLLDGMRLAQDAARGRVSLLGTMVSTAAMRLVASEIQTLLALDLGLTDEDVAAIRGSLDALAASHPHPIELLRGETRHFVNHYTLPSVDPGFTPPGGLDPDATPLGEELGRAALVMHARLVSDLEAACPETKTAAECYRAVWDLALGDPPPAAPEPLVVVLGERANRAAVLAQMRADAIFNYPRYVRRYIRTWVVVRGLRALAGFHARRRDGGCPRRGGFAAEDLALPDLGEPMTVHTLVPDHQLALHEPSVLSDLPPGTSSTPVLLALCPALPPAEAGRFD